MGVVLEWISFSKDHWGKNRANLISELNKREAPTISILVQRHPDVFQFSELGELLGPVMNGKQNSYRFEEGFEIGFRSEFAQASNVELALVCISVRASLLPFGIGDEDIHGMTRFQFTTVELESILSR